MVRHVGEEPWERKETTLIRFSPYLLLGIPTVITVLQPAPSATHRLVTLGIVVVAVGWVLTLDTLNPTWHEEERRLPVIYFLGLLVLATVLILRAPWYGVFAFTGYLRAFDCFTGIWRFTGVGLNALLIALSQVGGVEGCPVRRAAELPRAVRAQRRHGWSVLLLRLAHR